ncbi:MAG: hypothetical protein ACE37F_01875 [Nannocystaceae bacterium]|nr:hypothetical protein [bacterium]
MKRLTLALTLLCACDKGEPAPQPPAAESEGLPGGGGATRPELTADACEADGGTVVGDIGDGAIHQPDYVCESNGQPPVGTIVADEGGPIATEGAVCCGA